jgi:tetraacyldisaccharide 4'-kinase
MSRPFRWRKLLLPLVPAYRLATWLRSLRLGTNMEPVRGLRFPVVSIGNLSTGGSGKTPLTIVLAKALTQRGMHVNVLSRGYGRQSQIPDLVAPAGTAEEFGDEPLLIAREAGVPVYVAQLRYEAGLLAEGDAITVAALDEWLKPIVNLLDDGFQHRQLWRDVDILMLDRQDWEDNLLPAGNLREPLQAARRATVIAIPTNDPELEEELRAWGWQGPIWRIRRSMKIPTLNGPVAAFCGIARPQQFFAGLEAAGLQLAERAAFADHHRYTSADIGRLIASSRVANATALLTTQKDLVRLGKLSSSFPDSMPLKAVPLVVEIEGQDEAIQWLIRRLHPSPRQSPL